MQGRHFTSVDEEFGENNVNLASIPGFLSERRKEYPAMRGGGASARLGAELACNIRHSSAGADNERRKYY